MNEPRSVADLMTKEVLTVKSSMSVGQAFELMESAKVSALPVVDDGRCVGIVTATDLVRLIRETNSALRADFPHYEDCLWAVELANRKLDQQPVREIMSVCVEKVAPETSLRDAAQRLSTAARHHLVVESGGKVAGFLSSWDLAAAMA